MEDKKITCSMSRDEKNILLIDETTDSLIARISFYEGAEKLNYKERKSLGVAMIDKLFNIESFCQKPSVSHDWNSKCEAFKEAYALEENKNQHMIVWLLTNTLGIPTDEANRRFKIASELLEHPDFLLKEDIIVEKIYMNKDYLSELETKS
jgi:hypothetical protein